MKLIGTRRSFYMHATADSVAASPIADSFAATFVFASGMDHPMHHGPGFAQVYNVEKKILGCCPIYRDLQEQRKLASHCRSHRPNAESMPYLHCRSGATGDVKVCTKKSTGQKYALKYINMNRLKKAEIAAFLQVSTVHGDSACEFTCTHVVHRDGARHTPDRHRIRQ